MGSLNVDIYSPMRIDRSKPEAVGSRSFMCFGRLRPGVTLESARAEMAVLASQVAQEDEIEKNFGVVVLGLRDYLVADNRPILLILSGVVGFVLLIACANLASLLLTRGVGRQSELAVRAALGAGRWRIVQQLGVESLVLSLIGGALGLFAGWGGSRALAVLAEGRSRFRSDFRCRPGWAGARFHFDSVRSDGAVVRTCPRLAGIANQPAIERESSG